MKHTLSPHPPEVANAEKAVGAVLEKLEADTGGEVKDVGLEDMVDTDARTGAPVIKKTVDIKLVRRTAKRWST